MSESNKIFDLITPFLQEVQDIETMLNGLRENCDLAVAEGLQLDKIGDIIVLPRNGLDDTAYRAALMLQNSLNIGNGNPETLITLVKNFTGSTIANYAEPCPARFQFDVDTFTDPKGLRDRLNRLKPVAVGFDLYYVEPSVSPFAFADEGSFSSVGEGFIEDGWDETTGGYTAGSLVEIF